MGIIANIRGALGLQGPPGANGVVGLFVATYASKKFTLAKASSALTFNAAAGTVTVNVAGWYSVNWSGAVQQAVGSTITLVAVSNQCVICGPLT